jgi:hypothetical protein
MRPEDEVRKQLDSVVGDSYDPPRDWRATLLKWLAAAALAVVASVVIVSILDAHITQAQKAPVPSRPVPVQIIPAK